MSTPRSEAATHGTDNEVEGQLTDNRIVVISITYSASASEIPAGALQDNDRGVVVGRSHLRQGVMQRPFLPTVDVARLTKPTTTLPAGRSADPEALQARRFNDDY